MRSSDGVACSTNAVKAGVALGLAGPVHRTPESRVHTLHYAGMPGKVASRGPRVARHYAGRVAIDLHTHSTASDGTEAPSVVVQRAVEAGLDHRGPHRPRHDPGLGGGERRGAGPRHPARARHRGVVQPAREEHPPAGLPARPRPPGPGRRAGPGAREPRHPARPDGRADGARRHPRDGGVRARTGRGRRDGRSAAHRRRAGGGRAWSAHRDEAFARWLGNDSPYYVAHYAPDPVDAVAVVRAAGGVAVIAHPWSRTRGRVVGDALVEEMAAAGLAGIEVHHRDHDADAMRHLTALAQHRSGCSSPGRATTTVKGS